MSKYGNVKTEIDGLKFDSKGEARRWQELKLLERGGVITDLQRQVKYPLMCAGKLIANFIADYAYTEGGKMVVEDFKSHATITPVFRLKAKLFEANYGFPITVSKK